MHPNCARTRVTSQDSAYITAHYGLSSDQFVVIIMTNPDDGCRLYGNLQLMDQLAWLCVKLRAQATSSLAESTRFITAALNEGSGKWLTRSRSGITNAAGGCQRLPS